MIRNASFFCAIKLLNIEKLNFVIHTKKKEHSFILSNIIYSSYNIDTHIHTNTHVDACTHKQHIHSYYSNKVEIFCHTSNVLHKLKVIDLKILYTNNVTYLNNVSSITSFPRNGYGEIYDKIFYINNNA